MAFLADKGYFSKGGVASESARKFCLEAAVSIDMAAMDKEIRKKYGHELTDAQVMEIMEREYGTAVTRAAYRISAIRDLVGGKKVVIRNAATAASEATVKPIEDEKQPVTYVEFVSEQYTAHEGVGKTIVLEVRRHGGPKDSPVTVHWATREVKELTKEDAKPGEDYEAASGDLTFPMVSDSRTITIKILNDSAAEEDEFFYVDLSDPKCDSSTVKAELGQHNSASVRIVDDDKAGEFVFDPEERRILEGKDDEEIQLKVIRQNGCNGLVTVKYHTENDSAIEGVDYESSEGTLTFADGQAEAWIPVKIIARGRYDDSDMFRAVLSEPTGGAVFHHHDDGGEDNAICTVIVEPEEHTKDHVERLMKMMQHKMAKAETGHANWASQFKDAIWVGGEQNPDDLEEGEEFEKPGVYAWVMHIITIFWKVLFAFIPPVDYCGGWLSFIVALSFIGVVTAFIGDLASLLGCVSSIPDGITAVTLVALGTSLPDTFASKTAAIQDQFADASIGNITGSNSVNVFLGIGLPWMLGAFFWSGAGKDNDATRHAAWVLKYGARDTNVVADYPNGDVFVVIAGALAYSVAIFSVLAIITLGLLVVRRVFFGGELGGPTGPKYATSVIFTCIWLLFIILYVIEVMNTLGDCD